MPLDLPALRQALGRQPGASPDGIEQAHTLLCRREAPAFQRAARAGDDLLVACTQEQRLFTALAAETEGAPPQSERPIRFVNIREAGLWSRDARLAMPKTAALLAAAQLPAAEPVATVGYRSAGRCLVVGPAEAAHDAADRLAGALEPVVLLQGSGSALPQPRHHAVHSGELQRLSGWLGAFTAEWESRNPIDLELCTRCNACLAACPEGAIGLDYQVDLAACRSHRDCVRACDAAGAIDFARAPLRVEERFDLVLDLRPQPAFGQHQKPQGYFHVPHMPPAAAPGRRLDEALAALRDSVGEFDKPRFFHYRPKLCAHSRNERIGCTACIDVCSARAIRSDARLKGRRPGEGGGIVVEPHLCAGCGTCTTVCPSGAIAYAYPGTRDQGRTLRTLLDTYRGAGGRDALLLLHDQGAGQRTVDALGRAARLDRTLNGLPARALPVSLWHAASTGLDLWLLAIAQGASQVRVLLTDSDAPEYREALAAQMAVGQAILEGLGFGRGHLGLIEVRDARELGHLDGALQVAPARGVARPLEASALADKRGTLDMAIEHLLAQAPAAAPEAIALPSLPGPSRSPFGSLLVDTDACTLCLSCVGACPEGALLDNPERPQLRFIENNCVQCGLCAGTCPEKAIRLEPRLQVADQGRARKSPRVLVEMPPYACVRCGKPFGTLKAIEAMLTRLAGHAAFQGAAAERLKMCGDCRVIDLHSAPGEVRILDL